MTGQALRRIVFGGVMVVIGNSVVESADQAQAVMEQLFLQKAAEGQQMEIALGQLAAEKASNDQVKQFGLLMIHDHQQAGREVQQLASNEGFPLSPQLTDRHKQTQRTFAELFGKTFDQAYMSYILRDHVKDVNEFEQNAQMLKDPEVKMWASSILPVLKDHLERAKVVASAIGMM